MSILAEPPVAVVDKVALRRGTSDLARAYLEYLYSKTGQEIIAKHYYRPRDAGGRGEVRERVPEDRDHGHDRGLRRLGQGAGHALRRRRRLRPDLRALIPDTIAGGDSGTSRRPAPVASWRDHGRRPPTATPRPRAARPATDGLATLRALPEVFRYTRHALGLVWATSRRLTVALAILTLLGGLFPAAIAYVGALIVDAVVAAIAAGHGARGDLSQALGYVGLEGLLVAGLAATQRGLSTCQSLLRAQLGQRVNEMILEKALTLELRHFEDSEFYDKLTRARREASSRPLSLVMRSFGLVQNTIALASFGGLLAQFSPWAVAVLLLAGLPAFVAEAKFSGDAFRLFRWRSPETRMQMYLETVVAREDHAKEVKLFELGPLLLERYRAIFRKVFREDRALTIRRDSWGFFLGLLGTAAFYAAYAWIAVSAVRGRITLGQMTMYVMLFRQGQSAVSSILSADRRHVRGQPVPLDALRLPRHAGGPARRARPRPGPTRPTACASST